MYSPDQPQVPQIPLRFLFSANEPLVETMRDVLGPSGHAWIETRNGTVSFVSEYAHMTNPSARNDIGRELMNHTAKRLAGSALRACGRVEAVQDDVGRTNLVIKAKVSFDDFAEVDGSMISHSAIRLFTVLPPDTIREGVTPARLPRVVQQRMEHKTGGEHAFIISENLFPRLAILEGANR